MIDFLTEILRARASSRGRSWFETACRSTEEPVDLNRLLGNYAGASFWLGKKALALDPRETRRWNSLRPDLPVDHWGLDELGRVILLLKVAHLPADEYSEAVLECYQQGDSREQQSWLRGLNLLPGRGRFLDAAIDACRTNIVPLLEAIACENPYPAAHFPDLNFNQMVLKSLFNGIRIERILGLESRFNPELSRMADDYASEREAAGRDVPPDIWWVVAPRISRERMGRIYPYLQQGNSRHRYWAARSLGYVRDERSRMELERRRDVENDDRVLAAIDASLAKMVQ